MEVGSPGAIVTPHSPLFVEPVARNERSAEHEQKQHAMMSASTAQTMMMAHFIVWFCVEVMGYALAFPAM